MQIESLSHSSLAWVCTCKTTHSGGLAMCSCQNRDSVDDQDSWHLLSCLVVRWGAKLFVGYQAQVQEWILVSLSWTGVGVLSTALQKKLFFVTQLCASSMGLHCLSKSCRNPLFHQLFLDQQDIWKLRTLLHYFHTICLRGLDTYQACQVQQCYEESG